MSGPSRQINKIGRVAAVWLAACALLPAPINCSAQALDTHGKVEMFTDYFLVYNRRNAAIQYTQPERREVVLTTDMPWEGPSSAYYTVIQDGTKIRLYYRGFCPEDSDSKQVTCMAESSDGIHFTRPNFGLYAFDGSKNNNIIWVGVEAHNFGPFLDTNPRSAPEARYKALAGINSKLYAFQSADGIHWAKIQSQPVITDGAFDSLNTAFYDSNIGKYRCYSRYWDNGASVRAIQMCVSDDFIHWTKPVPNQYDSGVPMEQFYTNATRPVPGAEDQLLSFPKRFVPERTRLEGYKDPGVSDAVMMSSRDGIHWYRPVIDAWVRAGLDQHNWTQRSNMPAAGLAILPQEPDTFSMYISRHYQWPDNSLQRLTVRRYGFGSMHASRSGGEFTTRLLKVTGSHLLVNMATSAPGIVQVELLDEQDRPIKGFTLTDCPVLFGDDLFREIVWKGGAKLASLQSVKNFKIHFVLKDADVYAFQIADTAQ
jgi:hypothetical protein